MPIYDVIGNSVHIPYDIDGNALQQAYDIEQNPLLPTEESLVVMTYNVQWFTDFNGQRAMQQTIINSNDADIIGIQELTQNGTISAVGQAVLSDYSYKQLSNHKNYLGLVSKIQLSDYSTADFTNQDPYDASQFSETRAYQKCTISFGGKNIAWFNTHLCFHDASIKALQMMEIKAMADLEEYCIITGDLNSYCLSTADADYTDMYKPFVDAGYNLANCVGNVFTKTWTDSKTATSLSQMTYPHDNIITSANIDIYSIKFDTTKFSYLNGQSIDHIPVVARLVVN